MCSILFFHAGSNSGKPIDVVNIQEEEFKSFHNRIWYGEIDLANADSKIEYAQYIATSFWKCKIKAICDSASYHS